MSETNLNKFIVVFDGQLGVVYTFFVLPEHHEGSRTVAIIRRVIRYGVCLVNKRAYKQRQTTDSVAKIAAEADTKVSASKTCFISLIACV
jgi:hypothetical protein